MINSSLIEIFRSFSKEEIKEFDRMVSSGYFNRKSAVTKLWAELRGYAPEFNSTEIEREKIYSIIFPGKAFNYGTIKNLIHDLTKLAEKFIELKVYNANSNDQTENLLQAFMQRELNSAFEKNIKLYESWLDTNIGEVRYHSKKYTLEVLKQNYLSQQDKYYQTWDSIRSANKNLTIGYFINVFNNNYNPLFMQGELSGNHKNDFIQNVLNFYKSNPVEMDFRVKIYYNAFMLIYDGSLDYFYALRKMLETNIDKLSGGQKYNFCVAIGNFCSLKYNSGLSEFAKREYEIYRFMIDNRIYNIDNVTSMDGAFYRNVSRAALDAGELEWAFYFIEKFKKMLTDDVRVNYYFHAMIEYNIKLKNFSEALKFLSKIKHTNYADKLNIKKWDLITNYELGYFEELRHLIDSAKHFIKNDAKLSSLNKERLYNFALILTKLVYLKENQSNQQLKNDILLLKEEINNLDTSNKNWLIEKADELINQ